MSASKRAVGAIVDQAASSLQNFSILIASVHWFDLKTLGAFSLLYALVTLFIVVVRSLILEPLVVSYSGRAAKGTRGALGASLLCGLVLGLVSLCVALAAGGSLREMMLATAVIAVPTLVQDGYRYVLFTDGRQMAAAVNDGVCLIVSAIAVAALWIGDIRSPGALLLAWGLGCLAGVVVGMRQAPGMASVRLGISWLKEHHELGLPLAGSQLIQQGTGRASQASISAIGGTGALGMISASRTLITPLTTLVTASMSYSLSEGAKALRDGPRHLDRVVMATSGVLGAITVAYGFMLMVLPASLGRILAGSNWEVAKSLVIPTTLWVLGTALSQGPRVALRIYSLGKTTLRVSMVMALLLISGTVGGVIINGGVGAAWGFGLVSLVGQVVWWRAYLRARASHQLVEGIS